MKSSVTTRLLYVAFLVFVIVVSSVMLSDRVQEGLTSAVSEIGAPRCDSVPSIVIIVLPYSPFSVFPLI